MTVASDVSDEISVVEPPPLPQQPVAQDPQTDLQPTEPPVQSSIDEGFIVKVTLNAKEEYTDIENAGSTVIHLDGWVLHSEEHGDENQDCRLSGAIQPGETLRIWARSSDNDKPGFNCGFNENIWNNQKDAAILFDPNGIEIARD